MALLFVVGMSSLSLHYRSLTFPFTNDKQVCLIKISDNAEEKQRSVQYNAEILAYQQGDSLIALPHHPTCLLYFPKDSISYTLQRGEQLAIHARLQPPQNFGDIDFDYAQYLKRKGIAATAYVPMNSWKLIGKDTLIGWREKADRYREKIANYYHRLGFSGDELGVLTALTIG
jgi:competence protein ComEC